MSIEEAKTKFRYVENRGGYWIVGNMAVLDEEPSILASLKPVFLEDEVPILATMPPDQRETFWRGRVLALEGERALRAEDPGRTVYGPSKDAPVAEDTSWV